jgi:hypothetical protein
MKTRWIAVIAGAAVVVLTASYGAYADPGDGWRVDRADHDRADHDWDHAKGFHHHWWDHDKDASWQTAAAGGQSGGSSGPAPVPAPLLAAGIPAFALLGGTVGLRSMVRKFRRRNA